MTLRSRLYADITDGPGTAERRDAQADRERLLDTAAQAVLDTLEGVEPEGPREEGVGFWFVDLSFPSKDQAYAFIQALVVARGLRQTEESMIQHQQGESE